MAAGRWRASGKLRGPACYSLHARRPALCPCTAGLLTTRGAARALPDPGAGLVVGTARIGGGVYDPALRQRVLEILSRWGKLPESDLLRRLTPIQLVRFRPEVLRDLAGDGLIELRPVGDEHVIQITERGRRALDDSAPGAT